MKGIILSSKEIKRLILKRLKELELPLFWVAAEAGIEYDRFKRDYFNIANPEHSGVKEHEVINVLKVLGVDVKLTLIVKKKEDMNVKELKEHLRRHATIKQYDTASKD